MGSELTVRPQAAGVTPIAPVAIPSPSKAADDPSIEVAVDGTGAARIKLRDIAAASANALRDSSATRQASVILAAAKMISGFGELAALSSVDHVDWVKAQPELSAVLGQWYQIQAEARSQHFDSIIADLNDAVLVLQPVIPTAVWTGAVHTTSTVTLKVTDDDHLALARHALEMVELQASRFEAAKPGANRDGAAALCEPMALFLMSSADAAFAVDRTSRDGLTPDVEATSLRLDRVDQQLRMAPAVPWHISFARTFDAEAVLRRTLGLQARNRPYSGTIDPEAAAALIGKKLDPAAVEQLESNGLASPTAAVEAIERSFMFAYQNKDNALSAFAGDMSEPQPAKEPSVFDILLDVASSIVLTAAAAMLGTWVSDMVKHAVEGVAAGAKAATQDLAKVTASSVEALTKETATSVSSSTRNGLTSLQKALVADASKDVSKQLFKDAATGASKAIRSSNGNARMPLNAFVQLHRSVLTEEYQLATKAIGALGSALSQLDLIVLNALASSMRDMAAVARASEYDSLMHMWPNFRAKIASGSAEVDSQGSDAKLGRDAVSGALQIELLVDANPDSNGVKVGAITIQDGEQATVDHFKKNPQRLTELGLNAQWLFTFLADAPIVVVVGVGPDFGMQEASIDWIGHRYLNMHATGRRLTITNRVAARAGAFDGILDVHGLTFARTTIARFSGLRSDQIEKG